MSEPELSIFDIIKKLLENEGLEFNVEEVKDEIIFNIKKKEGEE